MLLKYRMLAPNTRGIYEVRSKGPGSMPDRALKLHPDAAVSFAKLESDTGGLTYSDIYRSAEASLEAMRTKTGVQPPGYSGHNFGLSVDVAVDATLKARAWTYEQLGATMEAHGWFCHRRDRRRGFEDWHFNFLGDRAAKALSTAAPKIVSTWSKVVENQIAFYYGPALDDRTAANVQAQLKKLKLYSGSVDGILGPISHQAVQAFQRAWLLPVSGTPDERTCRTLNFVAADVELA